MTSTLTAAHAALHEIAQHSSYLADSIGDLLSHPCRASKAPALPAAKLLVDLSKLQADLNRLADAASAFLDPAACCHDGSGACEEGK